MALCSHTPRLMLVLLALLGAAGAGADPRAATVSQIDWNAESGRLEVALRADPDALERALGAYFGTEVRLSADQEGPGADKLERRLTRYLRDTFVLEEPDSERRADLHWVGWQLESHRSAWLYFELVPPVADRGLLKVRLFFEVEPRQLHVVRLKAHGSQVAHTLSREKPEQALDWGLPGQ